MEIEKIIKNIEANYMALTNECRKDLQNASKMLSLERDTVVVREGQFANKVFFIAKGSARSYYLKDGRDITDWFAFENDFICSVNSFFLNTPSSLFIEVLEPSVLLEISRENVNLLSDKYIEFDRILKLIVTNTMLSLQERIVSIQFENAQQKYENLLKNKPNITQRVNLTHIASFLGITLETLSRIRNPKNRI
ncbi:MAG TPA: Crp/Fnr family transcriptional regulator [Sphingobacteriaceae bacterium]